MSETLHAFTIKNEIQKLIRERPETHIFHWAYFPINDNPGLQGVLNVAPKEDSPAWFGFSAFLDAEGDWMPAATVRDSSGNAIESGNLLLAADGTVHYSLFHEENEKELFFMVDLESVIDLFCSAVQQWVMYPVDLGKHQDSRTYRVKPMT